MIFSSLLFILVFLPVVLVLYYIVPISARNVVLLIGSIVFYTYGEPRYIFLLLGSVCFNCIMGRCLDVKNRFLRVFFLTVGISSNLSLLFFFKLLPGELELPLGISFYTFQSISYLVDVYRKEVQPEHSLIRMGTYIMMFPQLIVGPIVTYGEVEKQLKNPKVSIEGLDQGLKDFSMGLAMKVLLADRLTFLWKDISTIGYSSISVPMAWLGAVSFSLQIYFDFFGYSMMAVGLGKMLGYHLPENFNRPYMASSVREFYRRWHMTLGRWFTKYVYIPLGGSRGKWYKTIINLLIVWIMTSFWHGTSANFILWGMLLYFVIMIEKMIAIRRSSRKNRTWQQQIWQEQIVHRPAKDNFFLRIWKHTYVIFLILISWVCFAITDVNQLITYLGRMFGIIPGVLVNDEVFWQACIKYGVTMILGILMCTEAAHKFYVKAKDSLLGMIVLTALFWLSIWYLIMAGNNPFLYFRF